MSRRSKNLSMGLIVVLVVGTLLFAYWSIASGVPVTPNPEPVDTDGDGVADANIAFSMFQALHVTYQDGADAWYYPQSRTSLSALLIADSRNGMKTVSSIQTSIYFNLVSSKQVSSVEFSCDGETAVYTSSGALLKKLGSMPISKIVSSPSSGVDVLVVSASMSASDFQDLFYNTPLIVNCYFLVSCSDIEASVVFADGSSRVFALTGVQAETNQLRWNFVKFPSSFDASMVSVEWDWK